MISTGKIKSVDFYRKIPRDLTEASLSGAGLSIMAALAMMFLFGMELNSYLAFSTSTSVIVDKSSDGDFLRIEFNISFPALSCEFASVDISDVLGKQIEYNENNSQHGDGDEYAGDGSVSLTARTFEKFTHQHPILVVNFYAPWCYWSNRLKPSWEKAAKIIRERYDPEIDGRILLAKVDCTEEGDLCKRNHIQGYPSIRIFRKGSDVRCQNFCPHDHACLVLMKLTLINLFIWNSVKDDHGHHDHESYYGDRDTDSLVKTMETLVAPIPVEAQKLALEGKSDNGTDNAKRPAPLTGGCRIEGYVRVKKVPGNLVISAHSGAHSFDASQMNMSHVISHFSFGRMITPKVMSDVKRLVPYLGGSHDRLNGRSFINHRDLGANVTIEHYLQIVKSEVITGRNHKLIEEYEYTAHSSLVQSLQVPVAKFHFELSPMQVLITENQKSFSHFITNVCAIIGGVFTVAGIVDSILHNTIRMMRKIELGKNF
ncbi:protein disulfide-isomerase 5-3 [Prunus yedoensis var. nudiflora]|uniref:Protein disulfide-isomerase 5-3 n=1 Tax=Prunus yedoensis var. nudiflora TaxID=2094558 RepID=A0A315API5_PRUYE|nr:protein disulfide-isomerase 5-3 [Prunus yedoensis var. nudiflora]